MNMSATEAAVLVSVTAAATVAAVLHVLSGDALAGVYGAVLGWGGKAASNG